MRQHLVISMIALAIPINAAYAQASPPGTPVKPSAATVSPTNAPSPPKVAHETLVTGSTRRTKRF